MLKKFLKNISILLIVSAILVANAHAFTLPDPCTKWPNSRCGARGHVSYIQNNSNKTWYLKRFASIFGAALPFSNSIFLPKSTGIIMVSTGTGRSSDYYPNYSITLTDGNNEVQLTAKVDVGWLSDSVDGSSSNPALITHQLDKRGYPDGRPGTSLFVIN